MAHTNNWDETTPTNTTNAVDIDDHIRKSRLDVRERLAVDHKFASSDDGGAAWGIHKKVTIEDQIASPTLSSNQKAIYAKTDDKQCELRYKDKRGVDSLLSFIGEIRMRMGTAVPDGWLALNGGTIGNASSGADYAHANYEELFKFLYGELTDSEFPISGGRGASADADWAAGKKGTMPDSRSRSPMGVGTNSYRKLDFTSGGTHEVLVGDTLTGHTSGATAIVTEIYLVTGTWAGGDAAGYFIVRDQSGTFQSETLDEGANQDVCTIAGNSTTFSTYVLGDTGGAESHTLVTAETPSHTHGVGTYAVGSAGAHTHSVRVWGSGEGGQTVQYSGNTAGTYDVPNAALSAGAHTHGLSGSSASTGGDTAHYNIHPYIVVAMLIRY